MLIITDYYDITLYIKERTVVIAILGLFFL